MSEQIKKIIKKLIIIFCISFAGMFALLYLVMTVMNKNSYVGYDAEASSDEDGHSGQNENQSDEKKTNEPEMTEAQKLAQQWGIEITSRVKLDFRRVLLEEDYGYFSGSDVNRRLNEDFCFAYPKNLFHRAEVWADEENEGYKVSFSGRENEASLTYSQEKHERPGDFTEMIEELYKTDREEIPEASVLHHSSSVYVINGLEHENLEIYKVVKADEKSLYTMMIKTPVPAKEDEQTMVAYYTEYLYRSCGFSGSSRKPRSYSQYLRGVN